MTEHQNSIPFYFNPLFIIWLSIFFNHFRPQLYQLYIKTKNFYNYISENNPLILEYGYTGVTHTEENHENACEKLIVEEKPLPKFEDKYLDKFKNFPNEYQPFTDEELNKEKDMALTLYSNFISFRERSIKDYETDLTEINKIIDVIYLDDTKTSLSQEGQKLLLAYYELSEEYEKGNIQENDIKDYVNYIHNKKQDVLKRLEELKDETVLDKKRKECELEAEKQKIHNRLSNYINNYVLEPTPLGNVYMRYNVEKESFEYFSNNTVPYRYLEPIGRKYVMTYWCKPIFVDLEVELKLSEEKLKQTEEKEQKEKVIVNPDNNKKSITAQFKTYNQSKKITEKIVPKERGTSGFVLPPQIQANLPNVNPKSEKMILKENANRYTWEGRLSDFCPLKKIDKKIVDKNLNLSWSEYKKLQQQNKNN
jgi:hypothetical protein